MFCAKRLVDLRVEEALREAENRRALREAGIERQSWLSHQSCRLLYRIGKLLVGLGQRLQRLDARRTFRYGHPGIGS
jgi:hypothetical protein